MLSQKNYENKGNIPKVYNMIDAEKRNAEEAKKFLTYTPDGIILRSNRKEFLMNCIGYGGLAILKEFN